MSHNPNNMQLAVVMPQPQHQQVHNPNNMQLAVVIPQPQLHPQQAPQANEKPPIPNEIKLDNSPLFQVAEKLGEGGYGAVHKGIRIMAQPNTGCPKEVAIKFEFCEKQPLEWVVYDALHGVKGIPKVYYRGKYREYYVTVMELFGPSMRTKWLDDIKINRSAHEAKEWLMEKAAECIEIIQQIHERGIIHGDVKPENIVMGRPGTPEEDKVYFVDFGLSRGYRTSNGHTKYDQNFDRFHGTTRYASVNAHLGRIQTRRDDLESLAYGLAYLLNGYVHWSALEKCPNKHYKVGKKKIEVPPGILMGSARSPFKHFFYLIVKLGFDEEPDYQLMKNIFRMKLQDPTKKVKAVTHIDLTQNKFDRRFMLGRDVNQWVSIWTERKFMKDQRFRGQRLRPNVKEADLEKVIDQFYQKGYKVANIVYARGSWNVVFNRFNTPCEQIWFFSQTLMPTSYLNQYTKEGYRITAVACTPDKRGLFFMTKGLSYGMQRLEVGKEFPYDVVCENWRDGYRIVAMCSSVDGEKWVVVMDKGTGYHDQVLEFDYIYPYEGIDKRWEQGYHITCAAGNAYGCLFVFSRREGKYMLLPPIQRSMRSCDLEKAINKHREKLQRKYIAALCFGRTIC